MLFLAMLFARGVLSVAGESNELRLLERAVGDLGQEEVVQATKASLREFEAMMERQVDEFAAQGDVNAQTPMLCFPMCLPLAAAVGFVCPPCGVVVKVACVGTCWWLGGPPVCNIMDGHADVKEFCHSLSNSMCHLPTGHSFYDECNDFCNDYLCPHDPDSAADVMSGMERLVSDELRAQGFDSEFAGRAAERVAEQDLSQRENLFVEREERGTGEPGERCNTNLEYAPCNCHTEPCGVEPVYKRGKNGDRAYCKCRQTTPTSAPSMAPTPSPTKPGSGEPGGRCNTDTEGALCNCHEEPCNVKPFYKRNGECICKRMYLGKGKRKEKGLAMKLEQIADLLEELEETDYKF